MCCPGVHRSSHRRMENPPVDRATPYSVPANKPTLTYKLGRSWFPHGVGSNRGSIPAGGTVVILFRGFVMYSRSRVHVQTAWF
jgi:hypothetical protein